MLQSVEPFHREIPASSGRAASPGADAAPSGAVAPSGSRTIWGSRTIRGRGRAARTGEVLSRTARGVSGSRAGSARSAPRSGRRLAPSVRGSLMLQDVEALGDVVGVDVAVVVVRRPGAADTQRRCRSGRARSSRSPRGCAESVKSQTETPPWYHACTMMSRPLHRDQRAVVRDAVLGLGLVPRDLVVALEHQLAVVALAGDVVDAVGALVGPISALQAARAAAAELVGEDDLVAVVVEGRRVPEGEVARCPATRSITRGCSGSEMSSRMPSPMQAPAARSSCRVRGDVVAAGGLVAGLAAGEPAVGEQHRRSRPPRPARLRRAAP